METSHDPIFYVQYYKRSLQLILALFVINIGISTFGYEGAEKTEMILTSLVGYYMMLGVIEGLSAAYRKLYMKGPFKNYQVIMKMASSDKETARGIAYDMAVWPAVKSHKMYTSWGNDIRKGWVIRFALLLAITMVALSV